MLCLVVKVLLLDEGLLAGVDVAVGPDKLVSHLSVFVGLSINASRYDRVFDESLSFSVLMSLMSSAPVPLNPPISERSLWFIKELAIIT